MLDFNSNKRTDVGICIRVCATSPIGAKKNQKLLPSEVVNLHWEIANNVGQVVFSMNNSIDELKNGNITKAFLFGNSLGQTFLVETDVDSIISSDTEFVPQNISSAVQVPEWLNEPKKTWLFLSNFKQIDLKNCDLTLLNKDILLKEQILKPRFRTCYVKL